LPAYKAPPNILVAVIGGVVGGAVAILIIVLITAIVICRRKHRQRRAAEGHFSTAPASVTLVCCNNCNYKVNHLDV